MPGKGWRKAPDGTWTPPNQMRHRLEIDEDTWELIEDEINRVVVLHEGVSVIKSFLSTNAGVLIAATGGIVAALAVPATQAAAVSLIAFVRTQIAGIALDIAKGFVPTPEDLVEEIAEGAADVAEKARKAAEELASEIERRLRELAEKSEEVEEIIFPTGAPVGLPLDPALAEKLRKEGIQDPL